MTCFLSIPFDESVFSRPWFQIELRVGFIIIFKVTYSVVSENTVFVHCVTCGTAVSLSHSYCTTSMFLSDGKITPTREMLFQHSMTHPRPRLISSPPPLPSHHHHHPPTHPPHPPSLPSPPPSSPPPPPPPGVSAQTRFLCVRLCKQENAGDMADVARTGAAKRRRVRHERTTVAAELSAALHHIRDGQVSRVGLRAQKTDSS